MRLQSCNSSRNQGCGVLSSAEGFGGLSSAPGHVRNTRLHPNQHEHARKKSLTANPDNPTQPHSKPPNPQNPRNTKTRKSYVLHPEDTLRKPGKSKENTSTWYPWIRGPMKSGQRRLDLSIPSGSSCVKGEKKGSLCVCVYIYIHMYTHRPTYHTTKSCPNPSFYRGDLKTYLLVYSLNRKPHCLKPRALTNFSPSSDTVPQGSLLCLCYNVELSRPEYSNLTVAHIDP